MLVQSLYDSSELWYTLMLDCCAGSCSGYPTCKSGGTERSQMFALRQQHMDAWRPLVNRSGKPSEREKSSVRASLRVGNQSHATTSSIRLRLMAAEPLMTCNASDECP